MHELLTIKEFCQKHNISRQRCYKLMKEERLTFIEEKEITIGEPSARRIVDDGQDFRIVQSYAKKKGVDTKEKICDTKSIQ